MGSTSKTTMSTLQSIVLVNVVFCTIFLHCLSSYGIAAEPEESAYTMQALVMDMADEYIASLGESAYLLTRGDSTDTKSRWLGQSFLRNGVGAALDIATGPNPPVNLLDLLVLSSLQVWSFETHWIPAGIGEAGRPAVERLRRAEQNAWAAAGKVLSKQQLLTLRTLINAWIKENPDRTVVALVRFNEFADERKISSLELHQEASGLLKSVSEASVAVDEARLLGERLLWYASRYPYLLGEQAELTAYRIIDQPESVKLIEAVTSFQQLSETLTRRIGSLQEDMDRQQAAFFTRMSRERTEVIDMFFQNIREEREQLFNDLSARQDELIGIMTELKETIVVSGSLAEELTMTVNAIDRVVSRFDSQPGSDSEPLQMTDVRDAAIETGKAAKQLMLMLDQTVRLLESNSLEQKTSGLVKQLDGIVDKLFWRAILLIIVLICGLGLLRLLPQRSAGAAKKRGEK